MKPVDKKDLPKLYVLVACAVAIVGYFVYSMVFGAETPASAAGNKKESASGKTTAPNPAKDGAGSGADAPGATQDDKSLAFDLRMYGPPSGGRDPFQPVGPTAATPPPSVANKSAPQPIVPPLFPPAARPNPPRPPSSLGSLLGNAGATQGTIKPVELEPAPVPTLVVTGVVMGDSTVSNPRNIAILRGSSGEERRFVSVGDYVGNGYTVVAVHADGVEIQDKAGNRRVTIKLGQPGDNARAK